jgi:hypothetical protein
MIYVTTCQNYRNKEFCQIQTEMHTIYYCFEVWTAQSESKNVFHDTCFNYIIVTYV